MRGKADAVGGGKALGEGDADLLRFAPDHGAHAARRAVVRQEQRKLVGDELGVFDVDAGAAVGDVGQGAAVQFTLLDADPGRVADGTTVRLAFVVEHSAPAAAASGRRPPRVTI